MAKTKSGRFNFTGFGLVGLLALVILGGGALIFRQNSPTFSVAGGKGGDASNNSTINYGSGTNQNGDSNQGSGSSSSQDSSSKTTQSSQVNNSNQKVDVTATNVAWTLTYPVYRLEKDKCYLRGKDSVNLIQTQGSLSFRGETNGYGGTSIRGTISSTGQVNLSLSGYTGDFLTFEGTNPASSPNSNATVITGKVTAPNCPNDTFQLSKGN